MAQSRLPELTAAANKEEEEQESKTSVAISLSELMLLAKTGKRLGICGDLEAGISSTCACKLSTTGGCINLCCNRSRPLAVPTIMGDRYRGYADCPGCHHNS